MKKFWPVIFLMLGFTRVDFNSIPLGTPADKIVRRYGEPYSVKESGKDSLEYCYIERVSMNQQLIYENYYYLLIRKGRLVDKRFREQTRQPFDQMYRSDPNYGAVNK